VLIQIPLNFNGNRIQRASRYKYLGVVADGKLTPKENDERLCCIISEYDSVMHKVKHYANNQSLGHVAS